MSRALRAELEALQAQTKSVTAQLAQPATPKFTSDREALVAELIPLREQVKAVEERSVFLEREAVERESVLEHTAAAQRGTHASQHASVFATLMGALGLLIVLIASGALYDVIHEAPGVLFALSTLLAVALGAFAGRRIWLRGSR